MNRERGDTQSTPRKEKKTKTHSTHLVGSKLRGVDEHRPHHDVALQPGSPEQVRVAVVQRAHRGHEPHGRAAWKLPAHKHAQVKQF